MPPSINQASTRIINSAKNLIRYLGKAPQKSLRRFQLGLLLFAVSMALIFAGAYHWLAWQVIGLALFPFAVGVVIWGYTGILANRISIFLFNVAQAKSKSLSDQ